MSRTIKTMLLNICKLPLPRHKQNREREQLVPTLDEMLKLNDIPKTDEEFERLSKELTWVSYGVTGKERAKKHHLCHLETDHIIAILTFCDTLPLMRSVLIYILKQRFSVKPPEPIAPALTTNLLVADLKEALAGFMAVGANNGMYLDDEMQAWVKKQLFHKPRTPAQVFRAILEREKA